MKLALFILLLTFLTSAVMARHRRRLLLRRQSSYNKFMRTTSLNFEKAKVETLGAIFKRHVQQLRHTPNKQVELVFLIDSSGSVGSHYFYEEVRFVKNLLADFTVDVNATRVSVITFSSPHKIFRHIDYLSQPSDENHKCRLLQDDIPDVDYTAGGTHTLGAFLEAEKVLRSARSDATKAIFLMTDGYSNGGDPRPVAHKLKAQGVRIFTFGIRDGFVWELQDMASEPKNETCYILDSFEEFEALAKRALHTDLQSGSYVSQSISKCGRLCNNGGVCCHPNASCSCGTYTGKYKCLCNPGYFGSGLGKTGCKPCPPGTYKTHTGPGTCTTCPDEHQMTPVGSDSLSQCKCKKGYRNLGSQECTVFRCSKLSPPKHGIFVNNKCNSVFNAACGLKCKSGYELHGSSLRICQEDGQWSGQPAECIMKTCPSLPQPKNGHMICTTDDFSYSTVCRFTCNTGYQLVGSRKRTCLAIAFWTGIATRCREITCPPMVEIKDGTVSPLSCLSSEVVFGTTCKVSCHSGYKLKGPHTKQCTPDGTWMASESGPNLCLDESPPLLHCPRDIQIPADETEPLTSVEWTAPVPVDNSGLRPVLTSQPSLSSGRKFPIGKTTVTYRAKDLSNNVAECYFTIHVIDKTPPKIDKCVSPPPTVSKTQATAVTFDEPQFSDNSGKPVEVAPSRRLRDLFPMGKTKVVFTAFDSSNNNNTCVVDVDVVPHLCMTPDPPANGNITCNKGDDGVTCQIACNDGFAFADESVTEYSCQLEEGLWTPEEHYPFQDCSAVQLPNDIITPASISLTSDISCQDKQMLSEISQNLEEEMKNKLNEACENELSCKMGDLSFICEDDEGFNKVPQIVNRRRRRAIGSGHKTKLSFKFSLSGSIQKQDSRNEELESSLKETLNRMLSSMKNLESQSLDVKGKPVVIEDMSYDISDPEYHCLPGSILSNKTCVSCPAGTFCSVDQKECGKCPKGTYQDKENQTECIRCPNDQSTNMDNCKHIKDCKALCKPGTFSPSGLEPCETCHHGFYTSDYASRRCQPCGEGRTTPRRGSVSDDDCADLCPSGHASRTGLSPCYPCPLHSYQPKVGQMECLKCPAGGHTDRTGVIYMSNCVRSSDSWEVQSDSSIDDLLLSFNRCDFDNPCQNGGTCNHQGGDLYSCACAPGFAGETCGETVETCKSDPCLNGGSCYPAPNAGFRCQCQEGFTGKQCEVNIDDCVTNPCENSGLCVDRINSFTCSCQPGFTGQTCGDVIDNCDNNPCINGGSCSMNVLEYECTCPEGFQGDLCEQDIDECLTLPCQNDATCVDQPGGYSCTCIVGYVGKDCEENFDECAFNPCTNGGQCVDGVGDYTCNCPEGFTGRRCEEALSPFYQLNFDDPNILDYAQLTIGEPLTAVTASFWMKTTDDDNQGTPFSYAVKDEPDAFTITDYRNLNIYINGEDVSANQRLNDGYWQHVVFTWSSPLGEWKLYVNRVLQDQGYDLSTKRAIPAGGTFIIGQEQDEEGGGFSVGETFLGSLTQLNVWNRAMSLQEIEDMRYSCEGLEGNVIAWTNVQSALTGGLAKAPSSFCNDVQLLRRDWWNSYSMMNPFL